MFLTQCRLKKKLLLHDRLSVLSQCNGRAVKLIDKQMQIHRFSSSSTLITKKPLYLWNLTIRSSVNGGFFAQTLETYSFMRQSGIHGNNFTFPLLLKACANLASIGYGTMLHAHLIHVGFESDVFVQTSLVDMYSKISDLRASRQVFDETSTRSVIFWNSMIAAYSRGFRVNEALKLFREMLGGGFEPNSSTFVSLLSGFADPTHGSLFQGRLLHGFMTKFQFHDDTPVQNSLVQMYVNFGQIDSACSVFYAISEKTVISWTIMLGGYLKAGAVAKVFETFSQMRQNNVVLDKFVFVDIISSCIQLGNLSLGSSLHSLLLKTALKYEDPIGCLLISMYSKCGDLLSARAVFDLLSEKSIYSWTSMISGYANAGYPREALSLFTMATQNNVRPNGAMLATAISACADLGSLSMLREIEAFIQQDGLASDYQVSTSLIHLYCKFGSFEKAEKVFSSMIHRDLAAWSSMMNGYAMHGMGEKTMNLFHEMQRSGIKPDGSVYASILLACSHSGLVEDGLEHFKNMQLDYGIVPNMVHYTCLVDILSRAGHLELALNTIQEMPTQFQSQAWAPFLSACRTYCDVELGEVANRCLLSSNPRNPVNHVLMANLYTSMGKWKEAAKVRSLIDDKGLVKQPGCSQL
ncbi:hypothetical protein IC582_029818 [Cucumis melo]